MLIFGLRVRGSTVGTGMFFCPKCGGDRSYMHKKARRWFTLFFVPLIPLKEVGEYVECGTCHTNFQPSVLSAPTTAGLQAALGAAGREAVVWLLRLRTFPSAALRSAAVQFVSSMSGQPWDDSRLDNDLAGLDVSQFLGHCAQLSPMLNELGRESFVSSLARIAVIGGLLPGDGQPVLEQVASNIGLSAAHARGVLDAAVDAARQSPG